MSGEEQKMEPTAATRSAVVRLRKLLAAATPRPWLYVPGLPPWEAFNVTGSVWAKGADRPILHKPPTAEAVLVVEAVNALPKLLAVVEAAETYHEAERAVWRAANKDTESEVVRAQSALRAALDALNTGHGAAVTTEEVGSA